MNVQFWLIAAGLIAVALLVLVLPLLKKTALESVNASRRNLKIARQHLAELKQQLQDGLLSQLQFDEQYLELQQNLNDDLGTDSDSESVTPAPAGSGRWVIPVIVLILPVLSILLYFQLGDIDALKKAEIQEENAKNLANVDAMIAKLIERLKQNPDDLQGWLMLGRSYIYLQKYEQASDVFVRLYQQQPDNLEILLNYANSLAMSRNGQLSGEPAELIYKALKLAPDNNNALWLGGMAKAEEGDIEQSLAYLQKLAGQLPADSESLPQVKQLMAEVAAHGQSVAPATAAAGSATNIHVRVEIDAAVKSQVQAQQTVFIYAQALNGPKMPLAIVRKQVADLPADVDLNDSMAMQPNLHLSDFKQLKIVARISKTGNASTQAGDFIGSAELGLPVNDQAVSVIINQEVK